jgi:hypothetical protein
MVLTDQQDGADVGANQVQLRTAVTGGGCGWPVASGGASGQVGQPDYEGCREAWPR